MKCTKFRKLLIPYTERSLSEEKAEALEQHLAECESCAAELRSLTCTVDVLKKVDYPTFEPAFDLRSRVLAEIANEPVRKPWWQPARMQAYSAAVAGLLLVAIAGAGMWRMMERGVEVPASAPQSRMDRAKELPPAEEMQPPPAKGPETNQQPAAAVPRETKKLAAGRTMATLSSPETPRTSVGAALGDFRLNRSADPKSERFLGRDALSTLADDSRSPAVRRERDTTAKFGVSTDGTLDVGYGAMHETREPAEQLSNMLKQSSLGGPQQAAKEIGKPHVDKVPAAGIQAGPSSPQERSAFSLKAGEASSAASFDTMLKSAPAERSAGRPDQDMAAAGNAVFSYADRALGLDIESLEAKLRGFPTSMTTITDLMVKYREARRPRDEYEMAHRLTKLDPNNAGFWLSRAQAADRVPMPKTAQVCYQQAIKLGLKGAELEQAQARIRELQKK